MNGLTLLPKEMQERSLSDREIVLDYEDALQALDIIVDAKWAFLGWEGWAKYPDGKVGHCDYQGTTSIKKEKGQSWEEYIHDGYTVVKKTMQEDYVDWVKSEKAKEYELYFCITIIPR
jgi:hypothetical protein